MQILPILIALAVISVIAWAIQLIYWSVVRMAALRHTRRLQANPPIPVEAAPGVQPGVSVVVYAHNAGEALVRNLPVLLTQDYPDYEIIVVDDCSLDDTQEVLSVFEQRNSHVYHTRLTDKVCTISHRKLAMLLGVKAAHNDLILTLSAQSAPADRQWISRMVRHFQPGTDIVLGPVIYENRTSMMACLYSWDRLERLLDLFGLTLVTGAFAGWRQNMAFRRQVLFEQQNRAFASHLMIKPGEDDLFVAEVAKMHPGCVAVESTPESVVIDQDMPLSIVWSIDRLERAFTSRRYSRLPRLLVGLEHITRYLFLGATFAFIVLCVLVLSILQVQESQPLPMAEFLYAMGGVALLLISRMLWIAIGAYSTCKAWNIHRFWLAPLNTDLLIPIFSLWFSIKASIKAKTFDVRRG